MEANRIYCGDARDLLALLPDKSVSTIITDPPYGVDFVYDSYVDSEESWFSLMRGVIPEMRRVAKMVVMPVCRLARLGWFYEHFPPDWIICWYKGSPGHRGEIGFQDWEMLLVWGKNDGVVMHDYFYCRPTPFDNGHPCPKPIGWARWLVKNTTRPGDLVLDPFAGSGTTLVAANQLGRRFIGFELSASYCAIAERQLSQKLLSELLTYEGGV